MLCLAEDWPFLNENEVDLGKQGGGEGRWEEWREENPWSKCIVSEENK